MLALALVAWVPAPGPVEPDLPAYPWLYLRRGEPLAAGEQVVEVIAAGDVMLGRDVAGVADPFAGVASWLCSADLAFGNLECVVAEGGVARPGPYRLRASPASISLLRDAGLDVLGLANNHALDFGPEALAEMASRLNRAGITTVGAGPDAGAARQPIIRQIGGLRLAFLAFNAVPDPDDSPQSGQWVQAAWHPAEAMIAIASAREQADAVVVSVHWGYEYDQRPDPAQRDAARAMLAAGADLVIGHHPHVVQGTEVYAAGPETPTSARDGFVAYSLGNFVFDQQQGQTGQGLALRTFFDGQGLRAVQALPLWSGPRPRLMSPEEAAPLLDRVQPSLRRTGFVCEGETCRPVEVSQQSQEGRFGAGKVDLTGDGVPEQVRLAENDVVVYGDGVEAWRGLPEWRVTDLALGDPNDDGRGEMLLALWKTGAGGESGSHPFIVGYREGAYRVLWGGSAVADPLREVELGDVDGDGVEELVAIEDRPGGRAVTVWRWHGWGFGLLWRSPPARYRDLALLPGRDGQGLVISAALEP